MFGTIRKHQTWLWAIIITLTIISFVIFFSPYTKMNDSRGPVNYGSIRGEKITAEEYQQTEREVMLLYFLRNGKWLDREEMSKTKFDLLRETYFRLMLIRKQAELGIEISSSVAAQVARDMLRPFERMQITSPTMFVDKILKPRRLGMADLERFVRHELGIQELISTVALSGKLITPQEGIGFYLRENEQVLTEAAFFSVSNYLSGITASPEAISQFYSNRMPNYRIPERVQVSYVKFDATNHLAEADEQLAKMTDLNQRIDQVYDSRGTNYYTNATPAEAKALIRDEMRKELAKLSARKHAIDFVSPLIEREPLRPEHLAEAAKQKNFPVQVSSPFARGESPPELKVGEDFSTRAFEMSLTNEPVAGPIVGDDAVYVIAFDKRIPSENPPFDQVQERVAADYKFSQALSQARAAGAEFSQTVSNGLAQGKNFSAVCAEAKVTPTTLPPFSISTRELPEIENKITLNQLKGIAFRTPVGSSSGFHPTLEGGLVLHVKAKQPPDETRLKTELPQFLASTRQTRQNELFNEWFRKEFDRTMRDTPLFQQQQQQQKQQQQQQPPPAAASGASPS